MCNNVSVGIIKYARGTIWMAQKPKEYAPEQLVPGIQSTDRRAVIIVSEDMFNYNHDVVNILTVTRNTDRGDSAITLLVNNNGTDNTIQISQPRPIRKDWLIEYIGKLDDRSLEELRRRMLSHYGLGDPGVYASITEPYVKVSQPPLNHYYTKDEDIDTEEVQLNDVIKPILTREHRAAGNLKDVPQHTPSVTDSLEILSSEVTTINQIGRTFKIGEIIKKTSDNKSEVRLKTKTRDTNTNSREGANLLVKLTPNGVSTATSESTPIKPDISPINGKRGAITKDFAIQFLADKEAFKDNQLLADKYGYAHGSSASAMASQLRKRFNL